jgi:hypothetical protein
MLQEKIASLTPEQTERITRVMKQTNEVALRNSRALLNALLRTENPSCGHREHRLKPEGPNDWFAIDNLMRVVANVLTSGVPALLTLFAQSRFEESEPDSSEATLASVRRSMEMIEHEMGVKIASWILTCHFQLVCQGETRSNTADIHVDRIRGMVEPLIARSLREPTMDEMAAHCKALGI